MWARRFAYSDPNPDGTLSLLSPLLLGLALGFAFGWAIARARSAREQAERHAHISAEAATARAQLESTGVQATALEDALAESRRDASTLRERLAVTTAALHAEPRAAAERRELLVDTDARLREAFASLSAEALRTNNQSLLELAKASLSEYQKQAASDLQHRQQTIGNLVKPLHESLDRVDAKLQAVEKERAGTHSQLSAQLRTLAVTTTNLARALRTPNVRGGWGEVQLRRVVEMAGMVNHCHVVEKKTATSDEGRFVPDLIIKLPGGRNIIVDAMPYIAYRAVVEAADDATRTANLKDHARQVREHIIQLSSKR